MGPDTAEIHCYNINNSFESEYVPQDKSISKPTESVDDRYDMLVLISEEDYNDCISGDPDEEGDWEPVINQATNAKCWRYIPAKSYLDENGERLSEEEHAAKYKMSLDVITFVECCYSPRWADGFDYYPLWEAAISDGSIDGDEVDVDQLSQMIKARQYWMGDNGGYQVIEGTSDKTDFKDFELDEFTPEELEKMEEKSRNQISNFTSEEDVVVEEPLEGIYRERVANEALMGLTDNRGTSWLYGHQYVAWQYFLRETWTDGMKAALGDFAQYVYESESGLEEITEYQYVDAAMPVVEEYVRKSIREEGLKFCFESASAAFFERGDIKDFNNLSLAYIKRHPESRDALWEMLFNRDGGADDWQELLQGEWFEEFKDKVELSAKIINDEWGQGDEVTMINPHGTIIAHEVIPD